MRPRGVGGLRSLALALLAGLLGAAFVLLADSETGLLAWRDAAGRVARAEARTDEMRAEVERLRREIRGLRGDPLAVERAARERLGMVRPGEVVLHWGGEPVGAD
jgi:cell division protein FtsB